MLKRRHACVDLRDEEYLMHMAKVVKLKQSDLRNMIKESIYESTGPAFKELRTLIDICEKLELLIDDINPSDWSEGHKKQGRDNIRWVLENFDRVFGIPIRTTSRRLK